MKAKRKQETAECEYCDSDGETLERAGQSLCGDCLDLPVTFVAECERFDCGWSFEAEDTEFNRNHVKLRAQQEANSHEARNRVFDGEHGHSCEVREVDA